MRIIETCRCGARIEVEYQPGMEVGSMEEATQTMNAVNSWRAQHRSCLPSHPALDTSSYAETDPSKIRV